jgi:Protein tyrosine and serine/threonine kinase
MQVVDLTSLAPTPRQLQQVYLAFAKEIYMLSKLQHPHVITLHGCVSTLEELTLIMEVTSAQHLVMRLILIQKSHGGHTLHCVCHVADGSC